MSDYDDKPLVFRDDIEREFWGRVYVSETAKAGARATCRTVDMFADNAVVALRMRQRELVTYDEAGNELRRCAVCEWDSASFPGHMERCPILIQKKWAELETTATGSPPR